MKTSTDTLITISKEIQQLKEVSACYNHFLASYEASQMPVQAAAVQLNRQIIKKSIIELQTKMEAVKASVKKSVPVTRVFNYHYTDTEKAAIVAFNKDKRFLITE